MALGVCVEPSHEYPQSSPSLCLAASLPFIILTLVNSPYKRGFYCNDDSIRYPYKADTITHGLMAGVTITCTVAIVRKHHPLPSGSGTSWQVVPRSWVPAHLQTPGKATGPSGRAQLCSGSGAPSGVVTPVSRGAGSLQGGKRLRGDQRLLCRRPESRSIFSSAGEPRDPHPLSRWSLQISSGEAYLVYTERLYSKSEFNNYLAALYKVVGTFLFGAAISQSLTDLAKYMIGRLRPNFLAVCNPDWSKVNCSIYVQLENVCQGESRNVTESR